MKSTMSLAFAGLALACATSAPAAWIIPFGATATTELGPNVAVNVINGSGLSAESVAGLHAAANNVSWSMDQGGGASPVNTESITIDLGALYDLTDIHIWQFTRNSVGGDANRGVKTFDISVSADNVSFTEVSSDLTLNRAIDVAPANNIPDGNEPVQSFALAQNGVRYIELGIDITYENNGNQDWQGGFGEVRFEGAAAAAVPEPTTTALLGLGGLALMLRRRK